MILQALNSYYARRTSFGDPKLPPYGYSDQPISFVLVLASDGSVRDEDWRQSGAKRPEPQLLAVPQPIKRTSGPAANFLWDKSTYVLGVGRSKNDKSKVEISADTFTTFRQHHIDLIGACTDPGLAALLAFLKRWTPDRLAELRYKEDILDQNLVFRFDEDEDLFLHHRRVARDVWARVVNTSAVAKPAHCLVTGESRPIARLHPSIKGVRGAQSSGASIVSFNQEAFTSLGKDQGNNAPVSDVATFNYTTALNDLLRKGSRQRVQIGDATTVFWAEAGDPKEAEMAEQTVSWLFEPPSAEQRDTAEIDRLRTEVMERIARGRPLEDPDLKLAEGTRFYILGLAPNAARLSVRFWEATTLGALGRAFHQHWGDLQIDGIAWRQPPALWRLLARTAPARRNHEGVVKYDTKQIPPNLAGELMRAILTGRPYPRTILSNVLMRFRCDHMIDGLRVALIKASIVREMRLQNRDLAKEVYVSLNPDDPDAAYRLGRLFALLEKAQLASMDGINATICDRYYGAAAATPARVFGFLIKNSKNHLASLRKGRGAKWVTKPAATGGWLDREIGAIHDAFAGSFPASLTLEEQGRFSIGYYHQKYAKREDAPEDLKAEPEATADDTTNAND